MLRAFGPGIAYVTRTDIANGTPINIGKAQSFSLEFKGNIKELYGQEQLPLDAARGTVKVSGKMTAALLSGAAWNAAFFGQSFQAGGFKWNVGEAASVPGTSPYTVTVANSADFDADLGVIYAATSLPFTKVASNPAQGEYSVAAGVYTFAAADEGVQVKITYTSTVMTGQKLIITNQLLGTAPTFQLDYYTSRNSSPFVLRMNECQADSLSLASKLEDFIMPEFAFECFVDASDTLGTLVFPEVS